MQRFFSMFPSGRAGVALLCLRASVAAALLLGTTVMSRQPAILTFAAAMLAVALCVGFMTPLVASVCCMAGIALLFFATGPSVLCAAFAALIALAVALLGPGAYSLDARLFGRRRIILSSRGDPKDD